MKALIISDVHSNVYALRAVFAKEKNYDAVYCAGDIIDYGLDPCETIDWLIDHNCQCVSGNHDDNILKKAEERKPDSTLPSPYNFEEYTLSLVSEKHLKYLRGLKEVLCFEMDGIPYLMTHSYTQGEDIIENLTVFDNFVKNKAPSGFFAERLILGHTHRRGVHYLDDKKLWINPGSLSYRSWDWSDHAKGAHYIVIENGEIFHRHIDYDDREPARRVKELNFTESDKKLASNFFKPLP